MTEKSEKVTNSVSEDHSEETGAPVKEIKKEATEEIGRAHV